jgi:carboxymethylenebutenolidase
MGAGKANPHIIFEILEVAKTPSFWEKLQVDGQEMDVYASAPSGSGPFPAIVVAQHGGGVDRFIQTICDRFAGEGYAAVAPSLDHRITAEMLADGSRPADHRSDPQIIADINATVDWLQNHSSIDGERIGITGFCMGGRVAWLAQPPIPTSKQRYPTTVATSLLNWATRKRLLSS